MPTTSGARSTYAPARAHAKGKGAARTYQAAHGRAAHEHQRSARQRSRSPPLRTWQVHTVLDALVWNTTLEGCDDELGSVKEDGVWFGRLNAPLLHDGAWEHLTESEREFMRLNGAGAILSGDSGGFVYVEYFGSTSALTIA